MERSMEGFITVPKTRWTDKCVGYQLCIEIKQPCLLLLKNPEEPEFFRILIYVMKVEGHDEHVDTVKTIISIPYNRKIETKQKSLSRERVKCSASQCLDVVHKISAL